MSVNSFKPHVFVIPEDDADRQIADGFVLHYRVDTRQVQVVAPAGGWPKVLAIFKEEYLQKLRGNPHTNVIMLIDFDDIPTQRRAKFNEEIPQDVASRVFLIGAEGEPEGLKQTLGIGSFEKIGLALADDCDNDKMETWGHAKLRHNEDERVRLVEIVKPFLFN